MILLELMNTSQSHDLTIKNLDLGFHAENLGGLFPDILGRAALKLDSLSCGPPSSAQLEEILIRLGLAANGDTQLKELDIDSRDSLDLSHMNPEILSEALVKLETTGDFLEYVHLSSEQITHLFTKIKDSEDLRLARVDLVYTDISQVAPTLLAGGISRLEQ